MNKNQASGKVWILISGGIDSTACIAFYLEQKFSIQAVFVDYGQLSAERESKAAETVSKYYHIPLSKLVWSGIRKKNSGIIHGRNAFLLLGFLMEFPNISGIVALGIHSGTSYPDCTPFFILKMQSIFDVYTRGRIQIGTPFIKWTKRDIWDFCLSRQVPLHLTYSCECGLNQPCGKCLSCRDLEVLYASS